MKHISQPPGSSLCGQTCVAMIAGITLEESISVFGKSGETETREVIAALNKLGIPCGEKLIRMKRGVNPPPCCIMVLHYAGAPMRHWHWVVYYGGLYYDPAESIGIGYKEGVKITSYLPIDRKAEERVDFIVPERIREACAYRCLSYAEAAGLCQIDQREFGLMANGHKEIPQYLIFNLMQGLKFPADFFYFVRWERC